MAHRCYNYHSYRPCAVCALNTNGGQACQALGRSRGGFSTKIHVAIDGLGNPLRFRLSAGQRHDITCAGALVDGYNSEYVIADTSYDAMVFIESIAEKDAMPVIPPRANRSRFIGTSMMRICIKRKIRWNALSTKLSTIAVSSLVLVSCLYGIWDF